MVLEIISLAALVFVIALSCFTKINPGLLALGLAWLLGSFGAHLPTVQIAAGFPAHMFIVLVGVTYLFGLAKHNGTLDKLAQAGLRLIGGKPAFAPVLFFLLAAVLSALGAGNIGAVALLAPVGMAIAWETGAGAFFMTIAIVCGANAGTFSPFALTGIIANGLIAKLGMPMDPWKDVFFPNVMAQTFLAVLCYAIFLAQGKRHHPPGPAKNKTDHAAAGASWALPQYTTISAIGLLILCTVVLKTDIGFMSVLLGSVLCLINTTDGREAVKHVPWDTILMVCGINMLIGVIEMLGGLGLFTDVLAKISTPQTVVPVLALITGVISSFSSSSGVVLPTFIPMVPGLIEKIGGGDPTALISSINVGAHLVDISPLSSLGALCIASAVHEDKEKLFRHLLGFGLSMAVAGALICALLFGVLKITG